MSKFLSKRHQDLAPYTPGEQPRDGKYIKLNTNESPFPPSGKSVEYAANAAKKLNLYSDPECTPLVERLAGLYNVEKDEILFTNGSDEILNFAFIAFCDDTVVFPNITYGFYKVFAEINNVPYEEIPLKEDFSIDVNDYIGINKNIFIANPNAPTGLLLSVSDAEKIVRSNPGNVVVIDEAYIDFGGESCVGLIHKYDNLLVTQTFSKSRSAAGARLGFGIGQRELIADLNAVKYSVNPYNINSMTMALGVGILEDEEYTRSNCRAVEETREYTKAELARLGFEFTDSKANFVFAKHRAVGGEELYLRLKENGILVRHFSVPEIEDYNRITIGTKEEMQRLVSTLEKIAGGKKI